MTLLYYKTMDSVRKCSGPQGSIQLSENVSMGEACVDIEPSARVTHGREFCARLHTDKRTYYLQFDSEGERQSFVQAIHIAVSHL